jgi:two-component system chemotaxis response regulator CheY
VDIERAGRKWGAGKTVLIADDDPRIRKMLVSTFLSAGFETCGEAENGTQAIEVATQIKPDVITMDLSMPVMNGLKAASELRKIFPKTPVILFTLFADSLSEREISKAGVSSVLLKTAPLSTLLDKAQELLNNQARANNA